MIYGFILVLLTVSCGRSGAQLTGSFRSPDGCVRSACTRFVQWTVEGDNVTFEMEGTSGGYVALGLSADRLMGTNGIDDVMACHRDPNGTTVNIKDTYNPTDQSTRGNRLDGDDNIIPISSRIEGDRIICSFSRAIITGDPNDRNLNESAYLFLASTGSPGPANVGLNQHGSSGSAVSISNPAQIGNGGGQIISYMSNSTNLTGSFSFPQGCERAACTAFVQWTVEGNVITFELEGTSGGYVALGLSADRVMGTNGIDDVMACHRDPDGTTVNIKDTYNPTDQSSRGNRLDGDNNIIPISSRIEGGRIICSFSRAITTGDANDRNLNERVHLFLATTGSPGPANVGLNQHGSSGSAIGISDLVVLSEGGVPQLNSECVGGLIRAHGIFMFIAWGVLVQIGYFFAAYMKPAMVTGLWFQIHRAVMLVAIIPSVFGFILIFVQFRDNRGLIRGFGASNPTGTVHMVFGVVIIFMQFLNPLIGLCRCKPDAKFRWIFNIIHGNIVGWGVIILAWVNISLGLWQFAQITNNFAVFSVWIVFMIIYNAWDILLFIYQKLIFPSQKKIWEEKDDVEMKDKSYHSANSDPNASGDTDPDEKPKKKPSKDSPLRYGFLGITLGILGIFGIPIIILIAIGCF